MDQFLLDKIHFYIERQCRDGRAHNNKVVSALKILFPETEKCLFLTRGALSIWADLRPG